MTLFEVADLSTVWVEADVYEKDIPYLQPGQAVEATVEAYPNRTFAGKLALIYPQLDIATRTNRIRFELANPRHELRPGMFATVRINTPLENIEPYKSWPSFNLGRGSRARQMVRTARRRSPPAGEFLAVPERAVIDTGTKRSSTSSGSRACSKGSRSNWALAGRLLSGTGGLKAGDKVAAAGGFLIDAETRLNPAAASTYFGASGGPQAGGHPASTSDDTPPERKARPGARPKRASRRRNSPPTSSRTSTNFPRPTGNWPWPSGRAPSPAPRWARWASGKDHPPRPTGLSLLQGCVAKAKKDPDETLRKVAELRGRSRP